MEQSGTDIGILVSCFTCGISLTLLSSIVNRDSNSDRLANLYFSTRTCRRWSFGMKVTAPKSVKQVTKASEVAKGAKNIFHKNLHRASLLCV